MRHFVQYHTPDTHGQFEPGKPGFGIITDKPVDGLVGDRVWLVSRRENPWQYILCETFVVETVGRARRGPQRNFAEAKNGQPFADPVRIDHKRWFARLRRLTGNFAFGLQHIQDEEVVQGLLEVASKP